MQHSNALLLAIAGVIFASLYILPEPNDGAAELAEVTRISAAPDRETVAVTSIARTPPAASKAGAVDPRALRAATGTAAKPSHAWTAVVVADPSSPASRTITSSRPGDAVTRAELARDLQRELIRVGCYGGEINGAWTASTRRAMAAFNERVNATLPITEPDYILLTLVQGQSGVVCGASCPSGEVAAADGRCVPHAVVAQESRKALREEQRQREELNRRAEEGRLIAEGRTSAEARQIADARRVMESRKAVEAKRLADAAAQRQRLADLDRRIDAAAASPPEAELPWLQGENALTTADAVVTRPGEPLPGRMSVGAAPSDLPAGVGVIVPPPPRPAVRPASPAAELDRLAALDDPAEADAFQPVAPLAGQNAQGPKIVKRPPAAKRPKYAGGYSKARRGLPRPGSMPHMMQEALGGFH
ncbi:MAG: hypothetical protein ACT4OU_06190 [Hyphomicrobium sp.]